MATTQLTPVTEPKAARAGRSGRHGLALAKIILVRLLLLPPSLFVVATISFGLLAMMPGDPAVAIAGGVATPETLEAIRERLGLNDPLHVRYWNYLTALVRGDLGTSFVSGAPVADELVRYLPNTILLVAGGIGLAALVGIPLGILAAYYKDRAVDRLARGWITLAQSVPLFIIGLLLIFVFSYVLRWAPSPVGILGFTDIEPPRVTGFIPIDAALVGDWAVVRSSLAHLVLPVLTLALVNLAFFGKITRGLMARELASTRTEYSRVCGLGEATVVNYAFKAVRIPIVTYGMLIFAQILGSSTVVELVFAWPGVSRWGLEGVLALDIPVVQGFVIFAGVTTVITYLVLDVIVALIDPRVRLSGN